MGCVIRIAAFSAFLALTTTAHAAGLPVEERVTLLLESGRKFTAVVDARSDQHRVWLRFGRDSMIVLRPVRWERIVRVWMDGEEATEHDLREIVQRLESARADHPATSPTALHPFAVSAENTDEHSPTPPTPDAEDGPFASAVTSVSFDAQIANWDADVETDGLLVSIYPVDGSGSVLPVSGILEVELLAMKRRASDSVPRGRGQAPQRLGRWSRPVRAEQFTHGEITVPLPFQAEHPEFDTSWASYGLVHLRFVVPGQGTFESSRDALRVRPYAPFRDTLELRGNPRFLSSELNGR